jgi:hypothetical protein
MTCFIYCDWLGVDRANEDVLATMSNLDFVVRRIDAIEQDLDKVRLHNVYAFST